MTTARLSLATLDRLPVACRPAIRPDEVRPGILHLGLGAFHRAHQAVYTEAAIAAAGGDWGIIGVAPRNRRVIDDLSAQDGLYTLLTVDGTTVSPKVVGSLVELRHAAGDPLAVAARIADPSIRVITLTVTEKAYGLDPATGRLRVDDELRADLTTDRPPVTLIGLLVRGLLARAQAGSAPLAVVSCDNLPSNGRRLRSAVEQAFDTAGAQLDGPFSFPSTMVDRIVPATTPPVLTRVRQELGLDDLAPVIAEPFGQWVVEDDFAGGRPAWDKAGATFTDDVDGWERLKLRTLNGVHSAIAYLGALAGHETIDGALSMPGMIEFLERLVMTDIAPTIAPVSGTTPQEYGVSVLGRFANSALGHRTVQVAMDGSQKLPQRILGTITDRRRAGADPVYALLVVAAWMRFVRGHADDGAPLPLDDPLASVIRAALADAADTAQGTADALFALTEVFGELGADPQVRAGVVDWLVVLDRHGVSGALQSVGGAR
jgi:fructuronate reductase